MAFCTACNISLSFMSPNFPRSNRPSSLLSSSVSLFSSSAGSWTFEYEQQHTVRNLDRWTASHLEGQVFVQILVDISSFSLVNREQLKVYIRSFHMDINWRNKKKEPCRNSTYNRQSVKSLVLGVLAIFSEHLDGGLNQLPPVRVASLDQIHAQRRHLNQFQPWR